MSGCRHLIHAAPKLCMDLTGDAGSSRVRGRVTKGLGVQIRRKADNENLAEWIVDITTEADRQGSDKFVETYRT